MECYLCGAENSTDADFCHRCDGQLLKIAAEPDPDGVELSDMIVENEDVEVDDLDERRRLPSIRSAEHSRLQDALGLTDIDDSRSRLKRGVKIPKVEATSIPMIGTRTASVGTGGALRQETSRKAMIAIAVLSLLVGYLGYRTLTGGESEEIPTPDNLAFSNSTLPLPETTAPGPRPWTQGEIVGKFASAFVTVNLYDCPSELEPRGVTEPLDSRVSHGVVVDEHNVIFATADFPQVDTVVVRDRTGNLAVALVHQHASGVSVATSFKALNRTLNLVEEPEGDESFFLSHDPQASTTAIGADLQEVEQAQSEADLPDYDQPEGPDIAIETVSISATDQGDATAVWMGELRVGLEDLFDIGRYETELVEGGEFGRRTVPCNDAAQLVDASPPPTPSRSASGPSDQSDTGDGG